MRTDNMARPFVATRTGYWFLRITKPVFMYQAWWQDLAIKRALCRVRLGPATLFPR